MEDEFQLGSLKKVACVVCRSIFNAPIEIGLDPPWTDVGPPPPPLTQRVKLAGTNFTRDAMSSITLSPSDYVYIAFIFVIVPTIATIVPWLFYRRKRVAVQLRSPVEQPQSGTENDTISYEKDIQSPTPVASQLVVEPERVKVLYATWGTKSKEYNIRDKLQSMVRTDGHLIIPKKMKLTKMFGDPAKLKRKTMKIVYEVDGVVGLHIMDEWPRSNFSVGPKSDGDCPFSVSPLHITNRGDYSGIGSEDPWPTELSDNCSRPSSSSASHRRSSSCSDGSCRSSCSRYSWDADAPLVQGINSKIFILIYCCYR